MIRKKTTKRYYSKRKNRIKANHYIKYPKVRVLDEKGNMIGIMATKEAIHQAKIEEKDLILITDQAKPPVAKIIELSKYKYKQQQKKAKSRKNSKQQETKEVRFTLFMEENDFQARLRRVKRFLKKGNKVRLTLRFKRGRQITKKDFAYEMFARVFKEVEEEIVTEMKPKIVSRRLIAQIAPK